MTAQRQPQDRQLEREWPGVPAEGESLSSRAFGPDYEVDPETGCWNWLKFKQRGYGRSSFNHIDEGWAHRAYYVAAFGPIPDGLHVHHRCENPSCVYPAHLELTRHAEHLAYHKQADSSLTWGDVRAIRQAVKEGVRQQELRLRYGIAQPTLSDIITNTTWKDPGYTPGRSAVCALEECGADFLAGRANQRFCCTKHRLLWNARRTNRRARGVPLDGPSKWKKAA